MRNQPQLIAYVDRLPGGTFRHLQALLDGPLAGVFGGVHVLPFFHPIDGADAGFDPIDHAQVDARLGTWDDVKALGARTEIMADVIVNHTSRHSAQFQDFDRLGAASAYAGLFLTCGRVFPGGLTEADLLALNGPRPTLPFTKHRNQRGEDVLLWTTFTSDQVDIDVHHPEGQRYLTGILDRLEAAGVRAIRLDAVGYAVKKPGTSCFMIPETYSFIDAITAQAHARDMEVLVEVHGHHHAQIDVARRVDLVYDFALPPLVLHLLYTGDSKPLSRWLEIRPRNAVTVLDTHDGIGVADAGSDATGTHAGLLTPKDIATLIETIHERSRGESRLASGAAARNVDTQQINCTFFDALGRRAGEYLIARAVQCFVPGIPQVYYVGLLAGLNDVERLRRTGEGRDINRHSYSASDVERALRQPVVTTLISLLRLRNSHPAFQGQFSIDASRASRLILSWSTDAHFARLDVDLARLQAIVTCSEEDGMGGTRVLELTDDLTGMAPRTNTR